MIESAEIHGKKDADYLRGLYKEIGKAVVSLDDRDLSKFGDLAFEFTNLFEKNEEMESVCTAIYQRLIQSNSKIFQKSVLNLTTTVDRVDNGEITTDQIQNQCDIIEKCLHDMIYYHY